MREALIGIVVAVVTVAAWAWVRPTAAPAALGPAVWQVSTNDSGGSSDARDRLRAAGGGPATTRSSLRPTSAPVLPFPPARLQALLESRNLARVHFDKAPLADVIKFFAGELGLNFWVNWRALAAAGIEPSVPISLQLGEVTAARALEMVLRDAGGDTVFVAYRADDEMIVISTADDLSRDRITRVYNIRDLILAADEFERAMETAPRPPSQPSSISGTFNSTPAARGRPDHIELTQVLITLVQDCVDPTSWRDAGGSVGSVRYFAGLLIVTQTPESLREVERLLAQLRERLSG